MATLYGDYALTKKKKARKKNKNVVENVKLIEPVGRKSRQKEVENTEDYPQDSFKIFLADFFVNDELKQKRAEALRLALENYGIYSDSNGCLMINETRLPSDFVSLIIYISSPHDFETGPLGCEELLNVMEELNFAEIYEWKVARDKAWRDKRVNTTVKKYKIRRIVDGKKHIKMEIANICNTLLPENVCLSANRKADNILKALINYLLVFGSNRHLIEVNKYKKPSNIVDFIFFMIDPTLFQAVPSGWGLFKNRLESQNFPEIYGWKLAEDIYLQKRENENQILELGIDYKDFGWKGEILEEIADIIDSFPNEHFKGQKRLKAFALMRGMQRYGINCNSERNLVIKGQRIPSNIIDLIVYMIEPEQFLKTPQGWNTLERALQDVNFPEIYRQALVSQITYNQVVRSLFKMEASEKIDIKNEIDDFLLCQEGDQPKVTEILAEMIKCDVGYDENRFLIIDSQPVIPSNIIDIIVFMLNQTLFQKEPRAWDILKRAVINKRRFGLKHFYQHIDGKLLLAKNEDLSDEL